MQKSIFYDSSFLIDFFRKGLKSKLEYDAYMIYYYANIIAELEIDYDKTSI